MGPDRAYRVSKELHAFEVFWRERESEREREREGRGGRSWGARG